MGNPETTKKEVGVILNPSTMKKFFFLSISQLLLVISLQAQYLEFSLEQRVNQSDLIVEAKVIDQFTYKKDGLIYTANQLEVCAVIFERVAPTTENLTTFYAITYGGVFEDEFNTWTHMLTLHEGAEGLFFLKGNDSIVPDTLPSNSSFFEVYGQEQGFVSYAKDDEWVFSGTSLFESFNDIDDYIGQINEITEENNLTRSCILGSKSGLVLMLDTAIVEQGEITFKTAIKGQWGKTYNLEKVKIQIEFKNSVNLSQYGFSVGSLNGTLTTNYTTSWSQPNQLNAVLEVAKNSGLTACQQASDQFSGFLEIAFHPSLMAVGVKSVQIVDAKFKDGSTVSDFEDLDILYNKFVKEYFATPDITSFEPAEVCAGVKADQSSGNPVVSGHVIIKGNNFGDIDPINFATEIPNNYRVEFRREEDETSHAFKVTPLPEDYVYWTNTEIKVRVPTAGRLVNNNNLLSGDPKAVNGVTGRITVRTPDGFDDTGSNFLKVKFAHFNEIDLGNSNHSFLRKMLDQSGNGGYYLRFDPSFLDIYPPSPSSAKQDVIDAFCTWNNLTEAKLEVIDPCPTGALCFDVDYKFISSSGSTSTVLARGLSNPSQFACAGEVVITSMNLRFNNVVTNWKPSSQAGSFDPYVIKTTAYHEGGHMLQLGHVYNTGSLMYPNYSNNFTIDADAIAGGTHVTNVSAATNCTKKFIPELSQDA